MEKEDDAKIKKSSSEDFIPHNNWSVQAVF